MLQTARSFGGMVSAPHHLASNAGKRVLEDNRVVDHEKSQYFIFENAMPQEHVYCEAPCIFRV